ncbi:hypothetical protein DI09_50p10 [Mitosporidium daphniae]|uniref:Shq1 C-terminal domain-containing protein n=1 Tax=Mitosporidium daphniae TaxID=1485682 RepID=A0A098VQ49_9MICR|nr:uncharacterized protein DI09_50p10 [Mitosporidium daphniae]KGG50894.1 hypothetical protein DI09_50p10 [Mitosporidium daphniae]|eukprot:XP_013237340.1 uncharacterized protein DI09_50p10 [Mitosporidium daphniae]
MLTDLKPIYYGALDILLAYLYNRRIFQGEWTCESTWLVSKLAASISFLQVFKSLVLLTSSFVKRSLCFPLLRNYILSHQIITDASILLQRNGKRALFDHDEVRYPICKIFLNDYCIWLQNSSDSIWSGISARLKTSVISKDSLPWPILDYEVLSKENDI